MESINYNEFVSSLLKVSEDDSVVLILYYYIRETDGCSDVLIATEISKVDKYDLV